MSADLKWVDPHTVDLERWLAPHELELRVRVQIGSAEHSPEWTRTLFGLLAGLLRENQLPKSGRDYLAEKLEAIARGGDPRRLAAGQAQVEEILIHRCPGRRRA